MSLTALGTSISYGLLVLAGITLLGLIAWGVFVRHWAREEARRVAEEWLDANAPKVLRNYKSLLNPAEGDIFSAAAQQEADRIGEQS